MTGEFMTLDYWFMLPISVVFATVLSARQPVRTPAMVSVGSLHINPLCLAGLAP